MTLSLPATLPAAPSAERRPQTRPVHGVAITDDYAWLKAANWQEVLRDPALLPADIRSHLEAENAYAKAALAGTEDLQHRLVAEMRGRIKEDDSTVPAPDGPFAYFERFREGGQHPLIGRLPRDGGGEAILLDGDALAAGKAFFRFGGHAHSPDHSRLAWSSDDKGSEMFTIRVRGWATGEDLPDAVESTTGTAAWAADSRAFYYVRLDENHRPNRVFRHRLGDDPAADQLVFEEPEPGWFVRVAATRPGRFAVVSVGDHETSEALLLDLADPAARPRLVAPRRTSVRYSVEPHRERLFVLTNADGAEDFKVLACPLDATDFSAAAEVVPHRAGTYILDIEVFEDFLVRLERENALPRIVVRHLATGEEHVIAFAEEAYALSLAGGFEFATDTLRFVYSSMTTPAEVYDYDMRRRTRVLRKRQEVPSGHDPARYVTRRLLATAADGEAVPVSVLARAGTPLDGSAPLLLYGYGSYGYAIPAGFSTNRLSLVDRGFVYAIAHVRGGSERGWRWYQDGKREKKPNSFSDFIAAGEALAAAGWTRPGRIVAHGGSAGGMLMGAVANLAPELFAGIVAEVPFVDVLNTMLDDTLPLTPPEWPEWGNPIADEAAFRTILAYSPYENVAARRYPPIFALAGLTDPRVTYWEAAKWVARLRATMAGGGPALLRTNMEAGHGGAAGRFDRLDEVALVYAFALAAAGVAPLLPSGEGGREAAG
jgi:oligopeptidase B